MSKLTYLACGQTRHNIGQIFKTAPSQDRVFPAGVFLYENGSRKVLFDTGYAPHTSRAGVSGWLYSKVLPPEVEQKDLVPEQLGVLGISTEQITHVVLSHAHPDHIGGLRYFPNATIILTAGTRDLLDSSRIKDGVLKGLVPDWFARANLRTLVAADFAHTIELGNETYQTLDLFGDGEYRLIELPGHSHGHLGAIVNDKILLAGDAVWSRDLLELSPNMKRLPAYIQNDFEQYKRIGSMLLRLEAVGLRICPSHDTYPEPQLIG